jgi:hypothetical protein
LERKRLIATVFKEERQHVHNPTHASCLIEQSSILHSKTMEGGKSREKDEWLVAAGTWDAGLAVVHASKCGPLDFEETACKHDQDSKPSFLT